MTRRHKLLGTVLVDVVDKLGTLAEKACGAGAAGRPGFNQGNSCARGSGAGAGAKPSKLSRIAGAVKKAVSLVLKAVNAAPVLAGAVAKEAGASPRVAKAAMMAAFIADFSVPGVPVGSAAVILAATAFSPSAPINVMKKTIRSIRAKFGKSMSVLMTKSTGGKFTAKHKTNAVKIAKAFQKHIDAGAKEDDVVGVFAVSLEETKGNVDESLKILDVYFKDAK